MTGLPLALQALVLTYGLVAVSAMVGNVVVIWHGWAHGRHRRRADVCKLVKTFTRALDAQLARIPRDLNAMDAL